MIGRAEQPRRALERGITLIEVIAAIAILSVAVLGLAAAGSVANRQMGTGRSDMGLGSALQFQAEILMAQGYKNVTNGSSTVFNKYPAQWTVTGTDPKKVVLEVSRSSLVGAPRDTLVLYFAAKDTL